MSRRDRTVLRSWGQPDHALADRRAARGDRASPAVKRHLGLDEARSSVIATELDRFTWPGFDLRRTPDGREAYGEPPERLLTLVVRLLGYHARGAAPSRVDRDD